VEIPRDSGVCIRPGRYRLGHRPGEQCAARHRAKIVELLFDRAYYGVNVGETVIDVTFETRGPEQVKQLLAALTAANYKHELVR
jgi:hypothetical protein